jgi:hypothetical protein
MCTFISLLTSVHADPKTLRACIQQAGFHLQAAQHVGLQRQLPDRLLFTGAGVGAPESGCDCGTALVRYEPSEHVSLEPKAAKIRKLRRRGWSAARFAKWHAQLTAELPPRAENRGDELGKWVALLTHLAADATIRPVGLFLHEYCGDLETEPITVRARCSVRMAHLAAALDAGLEHDVYYELVA